jgi:hypothetical protein
MRKALTAAVAAITLGTSIAAGAVPAQAQQHWQDRSSGYSQHGQYGGHGYRGNYYRGGRGDDSAAIFAGVAGLALGAALASSGNHYQSSYYGPGYYSGYEPYAMCESRRWVYDPYIGRRVLIRSHYAC